MEGKLHPVERRRVYDSIVDQIRQLITDGTWKPGQRIPSERELTEMLSVGRTSVREALRILEAMGFIEIRAGDGSYVSASIAVPSRLHNLANLIQGDEYIVDLMEARELIESQIAFVAAESATPEDIAALEAIAHRQAASIEKDGSGVEENIEFHLRLAEATGNRVLMDLQQIFFRLSRDIIARLFRVPGRARESLHQHRAIIQAIEVGPGDGGKGAVPVSLVATDACKPASADGNLLTNGGFEVRRLRPDPCKIRIVKVIGADACHK